MSRRWLLLLTGALAGLAGGVAIGAWRMASDTSGGGAGDTTVLPAATAGGATVAALSATTATTATAVPAGTPVDIASADQLAALLAAHPGTVVVDFHAEWCKPCFELAPRLVELAARHPGVRVARVDIMALEAVGRAYEADSLPLLVRFERGTETARRVGVASLAELETWLGLAAR